MNFGVLGPAVLESLTVGRLVGSAPFGCPAAGAALLLAGGAVGSLELGVACFGFGGVGVGGVGVGEKGAGVLLLVAPLG